MALLWKGYQTLLKKHPVKTQVCSAATLMMLGDVISQQVVENRGFKHHDWPRSGRMAFIGLIYIGPCITLWYRALDYLVHGTSKTTALKKMLLDQIICAPTILGGFLTFMGVLSGLSSEQIANKFKKDYKDVLITNYYIWPAVQVANFYFVPLNHRANAHGRVGMQKGSGCNIREQQKEKEVLSTARPMEKIDGDGQQGSRVMMKGRGDRKGWRRCCPNNL
uniref:Mitochondrial inner membrane protein Mpv17 n=1 Tax=Eptatretus burgeri TaxID=7764 RepID=A0A8C4ND50_EPTBU